MPVCPGAQPDTFFPPSENEAREGKGPWDGGQMILVVDEKILGPEYRQTFRILRARLPGAKLSVLGEKAPQGEGCELLRGIQGFVLYGSAKDQLAPALRAVSNGHLWLPHAVVECFAQLAARDAESIKGVPFTRRETQVLGLLTDKLSNKEIAGKLRITERTVKFHVVNVFDKLGVHDRSSAAESGASQHALNTKQWAA